MRSTQPGSLDGRRAQIAEQLDEARGPALAQPALGAWLMGAALWLALRRRFGARTAGIGLVVLATMPFVYIGGQYANHDMLVAGTISVAVLCFARALEHGAPEFGWLLAGWAACAAAVLSKGLIGVVLPALVVGLWLLVLGRWRDLLRLLHPAGLALFALLALPWFVLMQVRYPGFFDYFVVEQHFRRYATQNFNNVQPFWFYLWVLPVLTLPWGGWLVTLWRPLRALAQRGLRGLDGDDGGWTLLMLWWTAAILGFFTLPASKLVGYIMPALLPGAALLAPVLARRPAWRPTAAVAALACIGVVVLLAWKSPHSGRDVGQALRAQLRPDDRVVMVEATFHDVAFEARLTRPPLIASNWADPDLRKFDNWRKELADAARFAPEPERAVLLQIDELPRLPCRGAQRTWIVAEHAAEQTDVFAQRLGERAVGGVDLQMADDCADRPPCRGRRMRLRGARIRRADRHRRGRPRGRPLLRQRDDHHCRGDDWPLVLGDRAVARLCGCGCPSVAGIHR